jgi:hypothetical protein
MWFIIKLSQHFKESATEIVHVIIHLENFNLGMHYEWDTVVYWINLLMCKGSV